MIRDFKAMEIARELYTRYPHGLLLVKGFQTGNGHISFLRPDLVTRMNQILAKHYGNALPPAV